MTRYLTTALLVVLLAFASVACSGGDDDPATPVTTITPRPPRTGTPVAGTETSTPTSTATNSPTVSTTPVPTVNGSELPGDLLELYLGLWHDGLYSEMYDLISTTSQGRISRQDFVQRYKDIADMAGITSVEGFLDTADGAATLQSFTTVFDTQLFGEIREKKVATFVQEDRWRVDWTPAMIFKDLSGPNRIFLFQDVPKRGAILDRTGEPLAITSEVAAVGVSKDSIGDQAETVAFLAEKLGMSVAEINDKIAADVPGYFFIPIKVLPPDTDQALIAELRANVHVLVQSRLLRVYPHGSLASHVIGYMQLISPEQLEELKPFGYTEQDLVGQAGIEGRYERELAGSRGARLAVVSPESATLAVIAEKASVAGQNITLSIDVRAQELAEQELGETLGAAVLIDPRDNSILAMASYPRYDPNAFIDGLSSAEFETIVNNPDNPLFNRAAQGQYPPGSTFKTITASAGLEKGGYTADSTFPCPPVWRELGFDMRNWNTADEGFLTIAGGLKRSCNPVFWDISVKLDHIDPNILPEFARGFGLGSPTGAEGLSEAAGLIPDPEWKQREKGEPWFTGDSANMAIGQGDVLTTPLQMANVYSSIAMGSLRTTVLVMEIGGSGVERQEFESEEIAPLPVSAANLDIVRDGMRQVVSPGGTAGNVFAGSPLQFAGKSGTAEDAGVGDHVWFAAYAELGDPQAVCIAMFETGESGSQEVGPIVRRIVEGYVLGEQ